VAVLPAPSRVRRAVFRNGVEPLVRAAEAVHLHVVWDLSQRTFVSLARAYGKPYVQSPHGMLADWSFAQKGWKKRAYMAVWGRRLLSGAYRIVLTAQGELDQSAKRHPRTPGAVIPLVFDLDPYRAQPTPDAARRALPLPSPDAPTMLYLSRLHFKKRPDLLIAAAGALRASGGRFNLVFAGPCDPSYERQLRDYARSQGVEGMTTFLGMVPEELKPSLYAACDLFVLPTSMENFGFVYFESLASGTPLVTTRGTDTWRELEASGGGRIVDMIASDVPDGRVGGGDVGELAAVLGELISDRERLRSMGRAGRAWVLEHMEPSVVVAQYLAMYKEAAEASRA
jgi:glycosyltransferase involved in cell wall biosynthesis